MFNQDNFAAGYSQTVSCISGLSAGELNASPIFTPLIEFSQNEVASQNSYNYALWSSAYNIIYMSNAVFEGVSNSQSLNETDKAQFTGEVKFIRAFTYFYLVNLFGKVPLILSTDYNENALAHQVSVDEIYTQIIDDLNDAHNLLNQEYRLSERTNPNKLAVSALLARVYLYRGDWVKAEMFSSEVIDSGIYNIIDNLDDVFLANSLEAIWQIKPPSLGYTNDGNMFILTSSPITYYFQPVYVSDDLINDFEVGDLRQTKWIGTYFDSSIGQTLYYPFKYKIKTSAATAPTEYSMVMRLAEQYLIRAEARAQQGNISGGLSDLNVIRNRANLIDISGVSQNELLKDIIQEKRIELFTEWGHRWLDLKRTNNTDAILSPIKPNWNSEDKLYPIPLRELDSNPNLNQNSGY